VNHGPRSDEFSAAMQRIVTEGRCGDDGVKRGAFVVYAAGNDGHDVSVENGFADDPNTVAVANCEVVVGADTSDPSSYSRVPESNFGNAIDICALGAQSYSLDLLEDSNWRGGGTSAACAAVSAAIGLLLTAFPRETHAQIRNRLLSGAEPIDLDQRDPKGAWNEDHSHSGYYGHGLLNVHKSML
jgi:subtilisin family serine protease